MKIELPKVIGHRGAAGRAPENTLLALEVAKSLNVKMVEFDVQLTKDNQAVVFHDEDLMRLCNSPKTILGSTFQELQQFDVGQGERIPLFSHYLMKIIELDLEANVEIKSEGNTAEEVAKILTQYWPKDRDLPLVSSFSVRNLLLFKDFLPHYPLRLLLHSFWDSWEGYMNDLNPHSVHINNLIITEAIVHKLKKQNRQVLCYTVNDKARYEELMRWGVDTVFSDYPDILLS